MTTRDLLRSLQLGQSHTFETVDQAQKAASSATHLYDRKFSRHGATLTRIE